MLPVGKQRVPTTAASARLGAAFLLASLAWLLLSLAPGSASVGSARENATPLRQRLPLPPSGDLHPRRHYDAAQDRGGGAPAAQRGSQVVESKTRHLVDDGGVVDGREGPLLTPRRGDGVFRRAYRQLWRQLNSEEEEVAEGTELSVEVSYVDTYAALIFLGTSYVFGEVAAFFGVPALVGQIVAGFLLGPPLADYVPYAEAAVLLGDIGLILLLVEAGIELDVGLVKQAGVRPLLIAVTGTVIPFLIGLGLAMAMGQDVKSAIATGACFAPTSLGVAANALSSGKALNTPVGQLIVASAVIDDMIGLIILSMLEVLVKEDPAMWEYFIPIISAVGYLIVLGVSALTWIPRLVQNWILPKFHPDKRDYVAFMLLWLLLISYLPLLYYSRASYLTGAFLAGLAFSQVQGVHNTFVTEARGVMEWLLRIFFSASIGFQVPIKMFGNPTVIAWGFAFYVAVLGKLPVGLYAPRYQEHVPRDYPFSPYIKDVAVTSVAMTCRGEFSFIIAAFGIGEGLFDPELYSSIIFAVLLSSITSPTILTLVLRHYNRLAEKYLEKDQMGRSVRGGKMPLHVNIQIRSGIAPGIQGTIKRCVNSLGLFVIDQRSWQPRGLGVVVATELYAVDSKIMVDVAKEMRKAGCSKPHASAPPSSKAEEGKEEGDPSEHVTKTISIAIQEDEAGAHDVVTERCEEIRQVLLSCPDLRDAEVKVLQWVPIADALGDEIGDEGATGTEQSLHHEKSVLQQVQQTLANKEIIDTHVDETPQVRLDKRTKMLSGPVTFGEAEKQSQKEAAAEEIREPLRADLGGGAVETVAGGLGYQPGIRRRRVRMVSSPAVGGLELWREDSQAKDAALAGAPSLPVQYDLNSGMRYGVARRQRMPSELGAIVENTPLIEERLGGIVRHALEPISPTNHQSSM